MLLNISLNLRFHMWFTLGFVCLFVCLPKIIILSTCDNIVYVVSGDN